MALLRTGEMRLRRVLLKDESIGVSVGKPPASVGWWKISWATASASLRNQRGQLPGTGTRVYQIILVFRTEEQNPPRHYGNSSLKGRGTNISRSVWIAAIT